MSAMAVLIVTLVTLAHGAQAPAPGPPAPATLRIVSPADDSYVSGLIRLQAIVEPLAELPRVASVSFYADGVLVCRVDRAPYECEWDAGELVESHHIRAVAALRDGGRLLANAYTKKLDHAESVHVDVVQVTATVTDGRGRFVGGLKPEAFRVFEDGKPQSITNFLSENVPLEIVAAIDLSGSMRTRVPELKDAVREFLTAVPDRHEVTLLGFNDNIFPLTRRTKDPAARVRAVDRFAAWGATALYDVILRGIDMLDRATGRKALIVFTDGEDQGSHATAEDVLLRLEQTDATLYTIGEGQRASVPHLQQLMSRLARQSGGRAFFPERIDKLRGVFREVLEDLSNQYLVSYAPSNTARDGTWRRITVEVTGGHEVRAREGYRAKTARR
jgi:Ca-activated chloride channel family protein